METSDSILKAREKLFKNKTQIGGKGSVRRKKIVKKVNADEKQQKDICANIQKLADKTLSVDLDEKNSSLYNGYKLTFIYDFLVRLKKDSRRSNKSNSIKLIKTNLFNYLNNNDYSEDFHRYFRTQLNLGGIKSVENLFNIFSDVLDKAEYLNFKTNELSIGDIKKALSSFGYNSSQRLPASYLRDKFIEKLQTNKSEDSERQEMQTSFMTMMFYIRNEHAKANEFRENMYIEPGEDSDLPQVSDLETDVLDMLDDVENNGENKEEEGENKEDEGDSNPENSS